MRAKFFFLCCVGFYFGISNLSAQPTSEKDYFVVIGQFPNIEGAVNLTDEANLKGFSAQYALHHKKKEYYVYLLQTSERMKAKSFLNQIRKETGYKKAWLYKGKLGGDQL